MIYFTFILFSILFSEENYCPIDNVISVRSLYDVGDTLSIEDQSALYPVCNGSGNYQTGDSFSFSDLNGNVNGSNYKLTIISMNATW